MHDDDSKVGKFIVLKIADYLLALPINDVLKVVNCSAVADRGLRTLGVVQLGRHMIRILDLHLPELPDNQPFLVITRNSKGELWGIAVDEPPNLLELPLEMMRSLPSSDRHGKGILDRVSHAAIISHEEVTTTIFLLDLNQAINTATNDSSSISLARIK